jgi:diacylglycerol kinase
VRGLGFMLAERNARLLLAASVVVAGAGFWLGLSRLEWCAAIAAGAVLLAMVAAVSIGVVVFGPRLF